MSSQQAGSRRRARAFALQALYRADLAESPERESLLGLWQALVEGEGLDGTPAPESAEIEFAQRLVTGVAESRAEIDELIERFSTNWRLKRMPVVDRNILRVATYELMACKDIPGTVAVNEAIELAKTFGTEDSRAFVNGIIDRIGRQLGRLDEQRRGRRTKG
jgi:N utilization substance protein B